MIWVCAYCGEEASDYRRAVGCCGEVHFEEVEECPECGSLDTYAANIEIDGTGQFCSECGHNWNNN